MSHHGGSGDNIHACHSCKSIRTNEHFESIVDRINVGIHLNSTLAYQPIDGLVQLVRKKNEQIEAMHLTKLNDDRKLQTRNASLADHKQWILAVASGRVDRVAALVQAGLKRQVGVKSLLMQYERAAVKLYKPKGYTNEDIMRSIVMLRLAGSRVAEFAHRSMSLPSPTTARRNAVVSPLQVSFGKPTIREAEENIFSFLGPLADVESLDGSKIKHQVFVLDELAIEKRPRWDDRTNMFLGACREHSHKVPLEFVSEKELEIFCNALDKGEIHAACEVSYFFFVHIPSLSDPCSIFRQQLVLFARFQRMHEKLEFASTLSQEHARRKPARNMPI